MFIKQRKVRTSEKFTSRWKLKAKRKREQIASHYTTALVQAILFSFLMIGVYWSAMSMRARAPSTMWYFKYAVPIFFLLAAVFVLRGALANVRAARRLREDLSAEKET
jgi:TRAP-type C4-dicarboxylate transport system permease small subunit